MNTLACALTLIVAALFPAPMSAQTPGAPPEMKKLESMFGTWAGKIKFIGDGFPPEPSETSMKVEPVLGGMYQKIVYTVSMPGVTLEGHSMIGFDPTEKKYKSWTFDNMAFSPREESGTLDGSKLVMVSEPQGGLVTRVTFDTSTKDVMQFTIEMKEGEKWTKVGECAYSRKTS